jgi:hypothetical protein
LKPIQQAMKILWAQFPIAIPIHCRWEKDGLVLIHLLLLPLIKDDEGALPPVVP